MVTINFVFWMFVIFFGLVGAFRGWAKDLLVTFSVIVPLTLTGLVYQSVSFRRVSEKATRGEKVGDLILSFILGACNAHLIFGSLWFYMAQAGYPYNDMITAPVEGTPQ